MAIKTITVQTCDVCEKEITGHPILSLKVDANGPALTYHKDLCDDCADKLKVWWQGVFGRRLLS